MADADDAEIPATSVFAHEMRAQRASLVGRVASGALGIDDLFAEQATGGGVAMVKIVVLAEKVPGVGKVRARRAMASVGLAEDARWGEIDPATLRALWSVMADAATRPLRPDDAP